MKIWGLGTILVTSWAQWVGTEPRSWTKDVMLDRERSEMELSPTICSDSTSFATSPYVKM